MAPEGVEELSEEAQEKCGGLKQQAADLIEDGKHDLALEKLTEAIALGAPTALIYCRRATVLATLGRPRAVINDCSAALALNPDSGKAFKLRGTAYKKLEMWQEAHSDFQTGLRIDYDESTYEASLDVEAKAKELNQGAGAAILGQWEENEKKRNQANKEAYEANMKKREDEASDKKRVEEEAKKAASEPSGGPQAKGPSDSAEDVD